MVPKKGGLKSMSGRKKGSTIDFFPKNPKKKGGGGGVLDRYFSLAYWKRGGLKKGGGGGVYTTEPTHHPPGIQTYMILLIYILSQSLQWSVQYHVTWDYVITPL